MCLCLCAGETRLKQRRRRGQRERQKSSRFRLTKQQLCTWIMLFCIILCQHCKTTWNFLISRFMEDVNTRQRFSFSFSELRDTPLEFNSRNIVNIWQIKRVEIGAMKFQTLRIHFLGDVFAAVSFVVAYRRCYTRRFVTTIFSVTQRCNIVARLFRMVTTLFQHCNAVLR